MQHEEVVRYLANAAAAPNEDEFQTWVMCDDAFRFLRASTEEHVPIHVNGPSAFLLAVLIPADRLSGDFLDEVLTWNLRPSEHAALYDYTREAQPTLSTSLTRTGTEILDGAEQLVFPRHFAGNPRGSERYLEISQKFVHAAGLHWVPSRNSFCRLDELGRFDDVLKVHDKDPWEIVTVNREALDLYIFASGQVLLRLFEFKRYRRIEDITGPQTNVQKLQADDLAAHRYLFESDRVRGAYVRGAQIIRPGAGTAERFEEAVHGSFVKRVERDHATFIIQDFKHGEVKEWTSDPAQHGNYFVESDLPFQTSPAFFRPEVLNKYKREPERFRVDQWRVTCRGSWDLRYRVNDEGQVFAYLCDLAYVPYAEQLHWKEHNERPKGPIPQTVIKTDFQGQFVDIDDPLQEIKEILRNFPLARQKGRSVEIWKPTDAGVDRTFEHVHYVHTDSEEEYIREVGALSKAVVEGLTTLTALAKHHGCYPEDPQQRASINLLEACLRKAGVAEEAVTRVVQPLRRVQLDRMPGAHRSSRQVEAGVATYRKLAEDVRDSLRLLSELVKIGKLSL